MISYYSDLRYKEVIDVHTGFRLGYVCDAEFDDKEGRLISLITPGRSKLFGLLGREDDYVLPWTAIVRIGSTSCWWTCRRPASAASAPSGASSSF